MTKVYLDANILQISVSHRPGLDGRSVEWGNTMHAWAAPTQVPYEPNTDWLRDQAKALSPIAEFARQRRISLCTGPEVRTETWFLKHGRLAWSQLSLFAGIPISQEIPPFYLDRVLISYDDRRGDPAKRLAAALSRADDVRFNALKIAAGGNKDADAYHLRCAEHAKADYFLTVDNRLKNSLANQKRVTLMVAIVLPRDLLGILSREA